MKQQENKASRKTVNAIVATQAGYTQFGKGVKKGNPARCLRCLKPIRKNDEWVKDTSESDPQLGAYSVIRHSSCVQVNGQA